MDTTADPLVRALFVVDGAESAPDSAAAAHAVSADGTDWTILVVVPEHPRHTTGATGFAGPVMTLEQMDEVATAQLIAGDAAAAGTACGFGNRPVPQVVVRGAPADAVERYTIEHPTDLVVVDTPGLAERLIDNGIFPVLTVPRNPVGPIGGPVLVAVDDSPLDDTLLSTVTHLFGGSGTDCLVVHVDAARATAQSVPIVTITPGSPGAGMASILIDDLASAADDAERIARSVAAHSELDNVAAVGEAGDPAAGILLMADEHDASMIVVGSHDRSWLSRLLRPSVSDAVIEQAHRPVLVAAGVSDTVPTEPARIAPESTDRATW